MGSSLYSLCSMSFSSTLSEPSGRHLFKKKKNSVYHCIDFLIIQASLYWGVIDIILLSDVACNGWYLYRRQKDHHSKSSWHQPSKLLNISCINRTASFIRYYASFSRKMVHTSSFQKPVGSSEQLRQLSLHWFWKSVKYLQSIQCYVPGTVLHSMTESNSIFIPEN